MKLNAVYRTAGLPAALILSLFAHAMILGLVHVPMENRPSEHEAYLVTLEFEESEGGGPQALRKTALCEIGAVPPALETAPVPENVPPQETEPPLEEAPLTEERGILEEWLPFRIPQRSIFSKECFASTTRPGNRSPSKRRYATAFSSETPMVSGGVWLRWGRVFFRISSVFREG
jgi:hypothetical protein